jgi:hypothetical protein
MHVHYQSKATGTRRCPARRSGSEHKGISVDERLNRDFDTFKLEAEILAPDPRGGFGMDDLGEWLAHFLVRSSSRPDGR